MSAENKLKPAITLLISLLLFGTLGYHFLEGWNFLDSFYMTLITISTIGYGEVHRLSQSGRLFTSLLIIFGVGTVGYAAGAFTQSVLEGQLRKLLKTRKRKKEMEKLSDHYIVCGYGRVGVRVAEEIRLKGAMTVVVESDNERVELAMKNGFYVVQDDATTEEGLIKAGVKKAKALISAIASDASNVFITLSAREINPQLFIVARMEDAKSEKKLLRAGANRVVEPYAIGGVKMALFAMSPSFVEFMDIITPTGGGTGYRIQEVLVKSGSPLHGKTILLSQIRQKSGAIIVGIKKVDGSLLFNPKTDVVIQGGDLLIVVGNQEQLEGLSLLAQKEEPKVGVPGEGDKSAV